MMGFTLVFLRCPSNRPPKIRTVRATFQRFVRTVTNCMNSANPDLPQRVEHLRSFRALSAHCSVRGVLSLNRIYQTRVRAMLRDQGVLHSNQNTPHWWLRAAITRLRTDRRLKENWNKLLSALSSYVILRVQTSKLGWTSPDRVK